MNIPETSWKDEAFNILLQRLPYIIIHLSLDGTILEFSHEASHLFDWRSSDVLNKNFFELCEQHNYKPPIHEFSLAVSGQATKDVISTFNINNVSTQVVLWNILPLKKPAPSILFFGINITPHKKMEEKESHTSAYLDNIINNLPHFIFWKDADSVFQGCNKKFAESVSLESPKDIIGKTDYDMPWSKRQSDLYREDDQRVIDTGIAKLNYEEKQRQLDNTEKVMLVSKVPIYDESKKIIGVLGIYTDITDRKQAEEALRIAKEEAEKANKIKSEFIRNMEHDVRTPFNGIWGLASYLWEHEPEGEKKELLGDIVQSAKELLDYCNGILDFSRIEHRSLAVIEKKFDIKTFMENIISVETPAAKIKKLALPLECPADIPRYVIGDQYRLQRILINLVSNAIKFTKTGYVKLGVKFIKQLNERTIFLAFIVEDSGIGIPQEKQDFIYEKFTKINPSNEGIYKGIGLGLRIVKQFIEELGGEIQLKSEIGKGSRFVCTIPFKLPLISDEDDEEK